MAQGRFLPGRFIRGTNRGDSGHTADGPRVIGRRNGAEPIQIQATGLAYGIKVGQRRWVTGDGVQAALDAGLFIEIDAQYLVEGDVDVDVQTDGLTTIVTPDDVAAPPEPDGGESPDSPASPGSPDEPEQDGPGRTDDTSEQGDESDQAEQNDDGDGDEAWEHAVAAYAGEQVAAMSVKATIDWIGDDLDRAEVVAASERQRDEPRKSLIEHVDRQLEAANAD